MNKKMPIGLVGLGLMGSSIATCLLAAGHSVTALIRDRRKEGTSKKYMLDFLQQLKQETLLTEEPETVMKRLIITDNVSLLAEHEIVIESISENLQEKQKTFRQLETVLSTKAIIGSNTSAIPVTLLQKGLAHPERILGIHWAEPAHITRFMEVICGKESDIQYAEKIIELAKTWGKEPSLLRKDIRGFITNRIMYAMIREAFYLVDNGYATIEDVDRSVRNDMGYWITFAGLFRFMDLTGIPAYYNVMKDLFPELSNSDKVPLKMQELVSSGAKGVSNAKGFYSYTEKSAQKWEELFVEFSYDIRKLAAKYSENNMDDL